MQRRGALVLCVAGLVTATFSFAAGRWTGQAKREVVAGPHSNVAFTQAPRTSAPSLLGEHDLSKITIENLGEVDFEHAYELLRSAPRETLEQWTRRLEALPTSPRKTAGITAFFKTLARLDTAMAAELALGIARHEPRWTAISAIATGAPAANLADVAQMYRALNNPKVYTGDLVDNWSMTDPARAAEFAVSFGERPTYQLGLVAKNWAAVDPVAARKWVESVQAGEEEARVHEGFCSGYYENDPGAAANDLISHAGDRKFASAIQTIAQNLFDDSPDAARAFVLNLPTPEAREAAVSGIRDRVQALWADTPAPTPDMMPKWLVSLPADVWKGQLGDAVTDWAQKDPAGYDAWFAAMPVEMRDRVAAEHCLAYNFEQPRANFEAGLNINDPQLRQQTFRDLLGKVKSRKTFRQLVRNANLPAAELATLERIISGL